MNTEKRFTVEESEKDKIPAPIYHCYAKRDEHLECTCYGHVKLRQEIIFNMSDDANLKITKGKDQKERRNEFNEYLKKSMKDYFNERITFYFDEDEDEDEEDEWDQIYNDWKKQNANDYMPKGQKIYKGYKYIMTYGGGGEGGYFFKNHKSPIYHVSRDWGTAFRPYKLSSDAKLEFKKDEYGTYYVREINFKATNL